MYTDAHTPRVAFTCDKAAQNDIAEDQATVANSEGDTVIPSYFSRFASFRRSVFRQMLPRIDE